MSCNIVNDLFYGYHFVFEAWTSDVWGSIRGAFDSAKNHKRQSVTAKRVKSQTPKFV